MIKAILLILCMINFVEVKSQVESTAYELMLKGLLSHSVREITPGELISMDSMVFLDSRERQEYEVSHINNAVWVGYNDFSMDRLKGLSKDQKLVVYCSVGYRSEKISERLKQAGFTDVSNLYGGIFEWVNEGKAVYRPDGKQTEEVHAYNKTWGIWLRKGKKVY